MDPRKGTGSSTVSAPGTSCFTLSGMLLVFPPHAVFMELYQGLADRGPVTTRHTRGTTMAVELLTERLSSPLFLPSFLLGY